MEEPALFRFFRLVDRLNLDEVTPYIAFALILGAVVCGCRQSRPTGRTLRVVRGALTSAAVLLVVLCAINLVFAVRLLYGRDAPSASVEYGARAQAVMALLLSGFFWHSMAMALTCIFVFVPRARTHFDLTLPLAFLVVSITLPMTIITYCPVIWYPGINFAFYVRYLAPPLACLIAGALWFVLKVVLAIVHDRGPCARVFAGLALFHLMSVCIFTTLVYVLTQRMAVAEMTQ